MEDSTLRVRDAAGALVFATKGKWLHPMFELEDFLAGAGAAVDRAGSTIEDKIIGLGAAALLIRLGFRRCRAGVLSLRAVPLLQKYGVAWSADLEVERIGCMTEDIITVDSDLDEVHAELSRRAGRFIA